MAKPQVLVFIDWYLPGQKAGGPVRSMANMVDHLRDRVDFHILTSDTDYTATAAYPGIIPDTWTTLPGGERVWYASRKGTGTTQWQALLNERRWDAIYINGIYSRWYSIMPLWLTRGSMLRRIVAVRGMLAEGPMRHGGAKKMLFLLFARITGLYHGVVFQATNAEEVEDVKRHIHSGSEVLQVPNLPRKLKPDARPQRPKVQGEVQLVSAARIAVEKNTLLAIRCLAGVKGRVTLHLHGPVYDEAYWAQCRDAIAALPEGIEVIHHGMLDAAQVPGALQRHHALLMPSAGENFGHSMLEALCAGVPLLISDRTPWRGLEAAHAGWDLPLDDPAAFTNTVQRLVDMDQAAHDQWSAGAYALGMRYLADPAPVESTYRMFAP